MVWKSVRRAFCGAVITSDLHVPVNSAVVHSKNTRLEQFVFYLVMWKNSHVFMSNIVIVGQLISRLIIIQKPLNSWVLQLIAVSFPLSQSMGLRCMSSNGVLFWTLNERSNCDLVALQIRITYQYSKKKLLLTSWGRPILAGKGTVTN